MNPRQGISNLKGYNYVPAGTHIQSLDLGQSENKLFKVYFSRLYWNKYSIFKIKTFAIIGLIKTYSLNYKK